MIFHTDYENVSPEAVRQFVDGIPMGRLVTVGVDGTPHMGLFNFVYGEQRIELHLARRDEQCDDLKRHSRCVFEVDEYLTSIPSYWVHPEYAGVATSYHRTVIFECIGSLQDDPAVQVACHNRLLKKYQPEEGYQALGVDAPLYRGAWMRLYAVCLEVTACRVKFKLGQNRTPTERETIIQHLRQRDGKGDGIAASVLERSLTGQHP